MPIIVESTTMTPLASATDLSIRGVDVTESAKIDVALSVASEAVRNAAEVTISQATSVVSVPAPQGRILGLPGPVTAVASVALDGSTVTDYEVLSNGLYRRHGWGCTPAPVAVEYTHGLNAIPADIVDLTCQLAIAWLNHSAGGGGSTAGLTAAALDDAREQYSDEAAGQVSPVFIPEVTRDWLRSRFSGGVAVVETL